MINVLASLSTLVNKGVRVEPCLSVDSTAEIVPGTIVWTGGVGIMNEDTYEKFRVAIKPKICRFYNHSSVLPYHDFCIALLYCNGYTLNHTNLSSVPDRTFISAWRCMGIMVENADSEVRDWLQKNLNGRSLHGYSVTLKVNRQNVVITRQRFSNSASMLPKELDDIKLYKGCAKQTVVCITDKATATEQNINNRVSNTPEGELMNLLIEHAGFIN